MCNFVHLHNHTEYSILDGYSSVKKLVGRAVEIGQSALAITDHGNMHGVIEFYRECKKNDIKPIIGLEAYITNFGVSMSEKESSYRESNHILLLAKDQAGYNNLIKLSSIGSLDGFYYKPRIDYTVLEQYSAGIIATSGCMGAEVPSMIRSGLPKKQILDLIDWYKTVFGENYYIELQHHPGIPELISQNIELIDIAKTLNIPMIVTSDVHYADKDDYDPHDTLLCIQTKAYKNQKNRFKFSDNSYYLKTREELEHDFAQYGLNEDIFDNTCMIADMCECNPEQEKGIAHMPDLGTNINYISELTKLVHDGMENIYGSDWKTNPDLAARVAKEMSVIDDTGFAQYYLIVHDILQFAKQNQIIWNIRGSGAGSIICYALGLSFIDPLDKKLLFERFLNVARVSIPDLDIDFPDNRRTEIITYLIDKYGVDRVAQVVTFGHMKARQVVRDVGRVYGYPQEYIDILAKRIPNIPGKPITIEDSLDPKGTYTSQELIEMYNNDVDAQEVLDHAIKLENIIRNVGLHAAAVIISDKELTTYTPLMRPTSSTCITEHITQFDYPTLESLGLLKVDCLGLSTLAIVDKCCKIIKDRHGIDIDPVFIPYEGPNTKEAFDLLSCGETVGVFQVESHGLRNVLIDMQPTEFQHIMDVISLYRPGPIGHIPEYIARMHGQQPIEYTHESLQGFIEDTQGIIIYQEQIIAILAGLAGYAASEADLVRKGISKKDQNIIDSNKQKFIDGCTNIPPYIAEKIWKDIETFSLYGFNRAHAASYARLTVQTAWLKANYPVEFMTACFIVDGGKYDKVITYMAECKRMGLSVLTPDINSSGEDFTIVELNKPINSHPLSKYDYKIPNNIAIRFGIGSIKGVGQYTAKKLGQIKNFENLNDLTLIPYKLLNKRSLESLIAGGVFDSIFPNRKLLWFNVENILKQIELAEKVVYGGQHSLFSPQIILNNDSGDYDIAREEYNALGTWINNHPVEQYDELFNYIPNKTIDVTTENDGERVVLLAAVAKFDSKLTKNGDPIAFIKFSDTLGACDAIMFSRTYTKLEEGTVVLIDGTVKVVNNGAPIIYIEKIRQNINISSKWNKPEPEEVSENPPQEEELVYKCRYFGENMLEVDDYLVKSPGNLLEIQIYRDGKPAGIIRRRNYGITPTVAEEIGLKYV